MNRLPHVSIIILNWNGIEYTEQCLNSIQKINYPDYQVIVVDNDSKKNEALRLKEKFKQYIHLIKNDENFGFAKGNNIGIDYAIKNNAEFICLLNNDTIVDKNFLLEMVTTSLKNNKIGMVAPRVLKMDNRQIIDNLGIVLTLSGLSFNRNNEKYKLFCPSGGAALYSVKMLQTISNNNNFFDPHFFAYVEDLDLGFRAILTGYIPSYSDKSIVYHKGSASTSIMSDFAVYHTQRNFIWTLIKNVPVSILLLSLPLIIVTQCGIFLLYLKRRRAGIFIKAYKDAIKSIGINMNKRKSIQKNKNIRLNELSKFIENKIFISSYLKKAIKK